jgi:polyhydroxyalkanoate synthesis regulator phasin
LETWRDVAKENPKAAEDYFGFTISQMPGGDKVITGALSIEEDRRKAQLQPFKLRQETADAIVKEAQAKFAPEKFGLEIDLTKSQIEQAKAARRAQDAAAAKSGAEAARARAEADQMAAGIIPVEKRPEAEGKFRKEYSDQTKGYQEVKSAYGRVLASQETAAGDLALIFNYMKMLDPGSVVREGEFATAQNATGVPERIQNLYNNLVRGERLNPDQRKMFSKQAEGLYKQAQTQEATVRSGIERIAKGYGLNTANIFYTPTEEAPKAPTSFAVTLPNGQVATFPNQQALDAYKKAAGL